LELNEPQEVVPILQKIYEKGHKGVLLFARNVSDKVMGVLLSINRQLAPFRIVSVKAPDALHGLSEFILDLEVLTGGRACLRSAGDSLANLTLEDLGAARKIWADKTYVGISGAKGSARNIIKHVDALKRGYARADKEEDRQKFLSRIQLFMGGAGIVWVGGMSEHDIKARKALTERTAQVIRRSLMSGILPGGGVALFACRPTLDKLAKAATVVDERAAYHILSQAMEAPLRIMLANGGYTPGPILSKIEASGAGSGFDLHSQQIVNMVDAGIVDSAEVIKTAVHNAIASAALALTIDVLVHHRNPEIAANP
jgi:chaperonin GroEL